MNIYKLYMYVVQLFITSPWHSRSTLAVSAVVSESAKVPRLGSHDGRTQSTDPAILRLYPAIYAPSLIVLLYQLDLGLDPSEMDQTDDHYLHQPCLIKLFCDHHYHTLWCSPAPIYLNASGYIKHQLIISHVFKLDYDCDNQDMAMPTLATSLTQQGHNAKYCPSSNTNIECRILYYHSIISKRPLQGKQRPCGQSFSWDKQRAPIHYQVLRHQVYFQQFEMGNTNISLFYQFFTSFFRPSKIIDGGVGGVNQGRMQVVSRNPAIAAKPSCMLMEESCIVYTNIHVQL